MAQLGLNARPAPPRTRRVPSAALARMGVKVLNRYGLLLECAQCGTRWAPRLIAGWHRPAGYWRCPNRCNW